MFTLTLLACAAAVAFLIGMVFHAVDLARWRQETKHLKRRGDRPLPWPMPKRKDWPL
jgi:hypothetical protein